MKSVLFALKLRCHIGNLAFSARNSPVLLSQFLSLPFSLLSANNYFDIFRRRVLEGSILLVNRGLHFCKWLPQGFKNDKLNCTNFSFFSSSSCSTRGGGG